MVKAKHIHHMTLIIKDAEKARDFFGRVLGIPEIKKPDPNMKVVWFGCEGNELHLMINDNLKGGRTDLSLVGQERDREGRHVAFTLDGSLDDIAATLETEHIPYHRGTGGLPQIFCEDSDGNFLELNTGWYQKPLKS